MNISRFIRKGSSERGAVIVMVAVWLPVLALFVSFAVDFAHFFDYSRNLQNRADAAALAAGDSFGGACFGNATPTQTNAIGQVAQQYAGPPKEDPASPYTVPNNLPFAYATFSPGQYQNVPNLTKGTPPNFHLLLNSTQNWDAGGADWNMGSGTAKGSSLAICSSTDEDGNTGPMVDVRVTQSDLGLFFPLLGITPTISAHARATLEGVAGENAVIPIAVRDPAAIQCAQVNYFDTANTGTPIASSPLTQEGTDAKTNAIIWDTPAGTSVKMPTDGNVYAQVVTGNCGDNPQTYEPTGGLLYINSWSTATTPAKPVITTNGVFLSGTCPNDNLSNQFFTDEPCSVDLTANVRFPAGATNTVVAATDLSTGKKYTLTLGTGTCPAASTTCWSTGSAGAVQIDPVANPGQHQFDVVATSGTGSNKTTTDLGVQQQAFAACNETLVACPNNGASGPIVLSQLTTTGAIGSFGPNAYAAGSTQSLVFTIEIAGLSNAKPGDPPTILRFSENCGGVGQQFCSHATGLINCGQVAQGTSQAITAIINGCPVAGTTGTNGCPVGSNNFDFCAPLAINHRSDTCTPAGSQIPPATTPSFRTAGDPTVPTDCIGLVGGNKTPIAKAVSCRIFTNVTPSDCASGAQNNAVCSANNWSPTIGASSVPGDDPRAITMVITAPEDLSGNNGPPVPIRNFAVFYVTGWNTKGSASGCKSYGPKAPGAAADALVNNQCTDGTAPAGGCQANGKNSNEGTPGEVWGYWIKYTDPGGIPSQTICNVQAFGNCVPALTR